MTATRPAFIEPTQWRALARGEVRSPNAFRGGMAISIMLHTVALVAFVAWKGIAPPARPPQYRIELIGAAGLKKQMGVVADQQPTENAPKPTEAPKAAERPPEVVKKVEPVKSNAKPEPKPVKATPNQTKTKQPTAAEAPKSATKAAPPVAGSGQTKGRGTDVTNMVVEGIQFPFPWYLENIQRQISLAWDWTKGGDWVTEVRFVIQRDGSVTDIQILKGSNNRQFDLEGRGAIESVGNSLKFGPLPSGFRDDVLPVYFTFRPDKN